MDYKIDKIKPEDQGDGLPNMPWRLRAIIVAAVSGAAAWTALFFLI
jgi:hypothetical protein